MPEDKDTQFIEELIKATQEGKIDWTATAKPQEFVASFRGKFSVIIAEAHPPMSLEEQLKLVQSWPGAPLPERVVYELRIVDDKGTVLLRMVNPTLGHLLNLARRSARKVDQAIDEILTELKSR